MPRQQMQERGRGIKSRKDAILKSLFSFMQMNQHMFSENLPVNSTSDDLVCETKAQWILINI